MSTAATLIEQRPADGPAMLHALLECVAAAERATAEAVALAGELAGSGVCERVEGLPLDLLLALQARMTGADRGMLLCAGQVLQAMPVTAGLFADGQLSWGQVRGMVAAVKRLGRDDQAAVDARVGETVDQRGGVDGFDPDDLVWAVARAADECLARRSVERREQRRADGTVFALQPDFAGGLRWWGHTADPLTAATIVDALDVAADPSVASTQADAGYDDGGGGDPEQEADRRRRAVSSRARQYGQAFAEVCAAYLGGGPTRRARPLLTVNVDLAAATATAAGTVELGVRGPLPTLTARAVEALAGDADLRMVLFDGARPLAASDKITAKQIPGKTRAAVRARDRGCRFPGSRDPLAHTDVHHIVERANGGDHHPENLVALSRRHHTLVHRHRWRLTLDPANGELTVSRGRRRYRSLPRGTPLARPPNRPPPDPSQPPDPDLPF